MYREKRPTVNERMYVWPPGVSASLGAAPGRVAAQAVPGAAATADTAGTKTGSRAWRLIVIGHIWRHALQIRLPVGVLVGIGLFLLEMALIVLLFAPAAASATL